MLMSMSMPQVFTLNTFRESFLCKISLERFGASVHLCLAPRRFGVVEVLSMK